jgi:hypothetical protein
MAVLIVAVVVVTVPRAATRRVSARRRTTVLFVTHWGRCGRPVLTGGSLSVATFTALAYPRAYFADLVVDGVVVFVGDVLEGFQAEMQQIASHD